MILLCPVQGPWASSLRFHKVKYLIFYEWVLKISWNCLWRHSDVTKSAVFRDFQYFHWKWPISLRFSASSLSIERGRGQVLYFVSVRPIMTTSSMKILILSTTSRYANKANVSTDSAKNVDCPVFLTKCTHFEVKYLRNWSMDRKLFVMWWIE